MEWEIVAEVGTLGSDLYSWVILRGIGDACRPKIINAIMRDEKEIVHHHREKLLCVARW